ncbi:ribosomal protein S6 kinase alpha-5-like [Sitodiplosis mosellana]|uniref:ribosomal protein S6 kinase alpha-5-like n=1 Tax=Sitodiplosis mosellana TaxID=263140 RepID=UPI002445034B|nr:ribosomal protein S6 kinase alpha-5-like [Sitodiplosis mosellana]XP_055315646.1 ribosomal protein S6 kinase alpha-5-like [Sitodiplosis mosellana]XP_055315647.1 ribosomal protein S6 kinase alpha-5-like [Sitodiplosis mosellana]XP_055315648.1 ribosomal protein S6 kinase alpha-5-like [Sitodiplosis mosellana]XP_055315649.1 ribosomal protein S6 kinase alpha-5-like [Sitodiplosis mosellana]XP_055315650.1 ribosomal protein S6 kinase alpha-5-like [Sitodiplosis mosellana]XP_055315651.1 ribosomal prot
MLKMGVKKKHDHESGFFEENICESTKSNRNLQNEWIQHYRNQPPRNMATAQQTNGDSNYLNRPMELLEISRDISTNNRNYDHYLSNYDRENMSSTGESKSKQSKQSSRNRTYRNQVESSSNAVQHTIVISDEDDDDEDTTSPNNAHNQANDGSLSMTKSNGQHSKRASDEIVDITDDDDGANEEEEDDEERYESRKGHKGGNHNHQGYRGKKSDQVSSSIADNKHTHTRSNKSNEKITSSEALAKEIEQASTIRPQANLRESDKVNLSHFELIQVLGTGAYGIVFLVRKKGGKDDGQLYAMKILKKSAIVQKVKTAEHTKTERQVLEAIGRSPFLVSMHYAFQTESKLYLVLDYVSGGELFTHLYKRDHFTEEEVQIFIAEIVIAIEQLHKLGIIYRDIKLENILLDSDGHIVVTDFGLSKELTKESNGRSYSFCGTMEYMAPEVVRGGKNGHDVSVDWWSVGVLCYELLTGASPFTIDGDPNKQNEISKRILKASPPMPEIIREAASDLITRLLNKEPSKRLGTGPTGPDEIKAHRFFKGIDWVKLAKKEINAPFKPNIQHRLDTSNFSDDFTKMPVVDQPCKPPPNYERLFRGFSFVAPDLLDHQDLTNLDPKPSIEEVIDYNQKNGSFFKKYTFESDQPIGDGSFSICMKCINNNTDKEYAVKILRKNQNVAAEIDALKLCHGHPNIVSIVEVIEDDAFTYIITEWLAGKELFKYAREQPLDEFEVRGIFKEILHAVTHMHSHNIAHRDLKLENIRFTSENTSRSNIKILDFGFACKINDEDKEMEGDCYTLDYAAPEILSNKKYTESCDLWSLGVILYALLCDSMPFRRHNDIDDNSQISKDKIISRIKSGQINSHNERWISLSDSVKDLIRRLLTVSPEKRIKLSEILVHDWLSFSKIDSTSNILFTTNTEPRQKQRSASSLADGRTGPARKKRSGRSNPKCVSVASTDSLVESTTSELGYSKSSSGIGGTSEVSDQCTHSISIESNSSITNDLNGRFIDHGKLDDIDNNNEKFIDHSNQEDSSCQHVISTSLGDPVIYQKTVIDKPQAYIGEQFDYLDDDSDGEDNLYGFSKNDTTILTSTNRNIDLKIFYRYGSLTQIDWNSTRSITPHRKRNSPDMRKLVYNTFAGDKSINSTPHGVPKRRRCQKPNQ